MIRTLKMGHHFTEGTADSNEVWLDITVTQDGKVLGRSGGMDAENRVDPWSHFVNNFVIDVEGRRIDRRNAQDIFVALYNHQIPPGAGQVVHYRLTLPEDSVQPVTVEVALRYRKFDADYVQYFRGDKQPNDLPILTLAEDRVVFGVEGGPEVPDEAPEENFPRWQRWNDYGIGLLLEGNQGANRGELRQAEEAFGQVEAMGHADGPLNLARVYLKEGRLQDAIDALARSAAFEPPAHAWTQLWLTGLVNQQLGALDESIENFRAILQLDTAETRQRRLDFRKDYRLLNELGKSLLERSKQKRGASQAEARAEWLKQAAETFQAALKLDPENVTAHYNLAIVYELLDSPEQAQPHRDLHAKYKLDDNARERAILAARSRYPAADHAANAIVIYDLQRDGAFGGHRDSSPPQP